MVHLKRHNKPPVFGRKSAESRLRSAAGRSRLGRFLRNLFTTWPGFQIAAVISAEIHGLLALFITMLCLYFNHRWRETLAEVGNAFSKAYSTLHADLRAGRFNPGARVAASDCLARLKISATPVREALSRLAGQGLLIDRPAIGYFVPAVDPVELKDLYAFAAILAHAALDSLDQTTVQLFIANHSGHARHRTAGELLRTLASLSSNIAIRHSASNLDDRLARLSAIDTFMFASSDQKNGGLEHWLATGSKRANKHLLSRFYRLRIKSVLEIASSATQALGNIDTIESK